MPYTGLAENLDKKINKGQQAPFSGVLVPLPHYEQASECMKTLPACESALQESIKSGISFGDYALTFGVGAVFGALVLTVINNSH